VFRLFARLDMNSGVGRDWYCERSQTRECENYEKLLQTRRQNNESRQEVQRNLKKNTEIWEWRSFLYFMFMVPCIIIQGYS